MGGRNEAEVDVSKAPTPLVSIGGFPSTNAATSCTCQVIRSLAGWSGTDGTVAELKSIFISSSNTLLQVWELAVAETE